MTLVPGIRQDVLLTLYQLIVYVEAVVMCWQKKKKRSCAMEVMCFMFRGVAKMVVLMW